MRPGSTDRMANTTYAVALRPLSDPAPGPHGLQALGELIFEQTPAVDVDDDAHVAVELARGGVGHHPEVAAVVAAQAVVEGEATIDGQAVQIASLGSTAEVGHIAKKCLAGPMVRWPRTCTTRWLRNMRVPFHAELSTRRCIAWAG